jgi:hypothetical protein
VKSAKKRLFWIAQTLQIFYYHAAADPTRDLCDRGAQPFRSNWNNFSAPLIYLTSRYDKYPRGYLVID